MNILEIHAWSCSNLRLETVKKISSEPIKICGTSTLQSHAVYGNLMLWNFYLRL